MACMDTTQLDRLHEELAAADPAEAPEPADELASRLAEELEATAPQDGDAA